MWEYLVADYDEPSGVGSLMDREFVASPDRGVESRKSTMETTYATP